MSCEYITTAVVMAAMPLGYYAFKNAWSRLVLFKRCGVLFVACGLAIGIFFVALSFQYVLAGETFLDGVRHIGNRFLVRTYGGGDIQELGSREGMRLLDLLRWYAAAPAAFDFRRIGFDWVMSMKWIMVLYASVTVVWLLLYRRYRENRKAARMKALLATFWLSILAPGSWFVVFKGHSEVHRSLAPITSSACRY